MSGRNNTFVKIIWNTNGLLLWALISIAIQGCSEELGTLTRTYEAIFAPVSKTVIASNGDVSWSAGDQIWYYSQDGGQLLTHTVAEDASSVSMTLTLSTDATYLTAIYGTSSISNYSRDALTLTNAIKAEQSGTFNDGHIAVARITQVSATSLQFYNIVSFVTFSTSRTDVAYVVFSSKDETPLHSNGTVSVGFSDNIPMASFIAGQGSSIKVNLNGAGLYYIATLPNTLPNGFTLSCYDADDNLIGSATGNNVLSVQRAAIARLGLIDSHLVDINGIKLIGYDPDTNWDGTQNSDAGITHGMYGEDYNWDTNGNSGANINKGSYNGDSNWDSNGNSNANVGKDGYGNDSNWDTNNNSGGNLGINGYGNDINWG